MTLQELRSAAAWPFKLQILNASADIIARTDCTGFSSRLFAESEIIKIWPISDGLAVMLNITDDQKRETEA